MVLRAALVIAGFFAGQEAGPAGQTENEYALAARSLFKAGEYRKAAETCERGMQAFPNSEPIEAVYLALPAEVLAEGLATWFERAQRTSDVTELITLGRVLSDLDPGRKTQGPEMAERLLARAIELAPANPSAWYNYGRAFRLRGRPEAMFAAWQKALSLNPDDKLKIQIYTHIARQKRANSPAEAEQAFRAALETNRRLPVHRPDAAFEYFLFLKAQARPEDARPLLREILRWDPQFPPARMERARSFAALEQWAPAIEDCEFVLRIAGESTNLLRSAHGLLARAYQVTNQPAKARVHQAWIESHAEAAAPRP
jgi:tetratricopeptide (TPR) repeat protein